MVPKIVWCVLFYLFVIVNAQKDSADSPMKAIKKVYNNCENDSDLLKCMKIQAIKITERALKAKNIQFMDGFSMVQKSESLSRSINDATHLSDNELIDLPSEKLDYTLFDLISKFINTHQVQLNVPRLFSNQDTPRLVEEGRKKMKKYLGPFIAAMAIKSGILTMVYHSIAIVAGKALIIGKIALVISAIIGLKKLVTPEGHEKTTYEIVKHPHIQNSHTFSSSHGDFDSHDSQQYHRSLDDNADMLMQDRAYRGHF